MYDDDLIYLLANMFSKTEILTAVLARVGECGEKSNGLITYTQKFGRMSPVPIYAPE